MPSIVVIRYSKTVTTRPSFLRVVRPKASSFPEKDLTLYNCKHLLAMLDTSTTVPNLSARDARHSQHYDGKLDPLDEERVGPEYRGIDLSNVLVSYLSPWTQLPHLVQRHACASRSAPCRRIINRSSLSGSSSNIQRARAHYLLNPRATVLSWRWKDFLRGSTLLQEDLAHRAKTTFRGMH